MRGVLIQAQASAVFNIELKSHSLDLATKTRHFLLQRFDTVGQLQSGLLVLLGHLPNLFAKLQNGAPGLVVGKGRSGGGKKQQTGCGSGCQEGARFD